MVEREPVDSHIPCSPSEILARLLQSNEPIMTLRAVCEGIPVRQDNKEIERLWENERWEELEYLCLPTLLRCLKECSMIYEVDEKEIFYEAFFNLQNLIRSWSPGKKLNNGKTD